MNESRRVIRAAAVIATVARFLTLEAEAAKEFDGYFMPRPAEPDPASFVTPHVKWAKPLDGGPIKALIVSRWLAAREGYELAQRLDLEFERFELHRRSGFMYFDWIVGNEPDRLLELLREDYDVILVGGSKISAWPREAQFLLLDQLLKGTGLVLVNLPERPFEGTPADPVVLQEKVGSLPDVLPGVPYHYFTGWQAMAGRQYKLYSKGRMPPALKEIPLRFPADSTLYQTRGGRCAVIASSGAGGTITFDPGIFPGASTPPGKPLIPEYMFSMLAKTVRWAAGRTPAVAIEKVTPDNETLDPAAPGQAEVTINAREPFEGQIRFVARSRWNEIVREETRPLKAAPGISRQTWALTELGAGEFGLDVWILKGDRIVDWGSGLFALGGRASVETIALDKAYFEPDEPVSAAVTIKNAPAGSVLRVGIRETEKLRVLEQAVCATAGDAPVRVSLKIRNPVHIAYWLEASVEAGGRSVARARKEFSVPVRDRDEFYCVGCDGSPPLWNHIWRLRARRMKELGVDCNRGADTSVISLLAHAYDGITPGAFFTHVGGCASALLGNKCLGDPDYHKELVAGLSDIAGVLKPYGGACYNLGDDMLVNYRQCKEPGCFERFVAYLRTQYPSIEALNAEWGSSFATWEEVTPEYVFQTSWHGENNRVPAVDYWYYHEDLYLKVMRLASDAIHAVDPQAWVGQDAMHCENVLDQFAVDQTYVCPYFRHLDVKKLGSFIPNKQGCYGALYGLQGYAGRDPQLMAVPWDVLFGGNNAVVFFSFLEGIAGDLTLYPMGYMMEPIRELKGGIGNVLARAEIQYAPVLLYQSRGAMHADRAPPFRTHSPQRASEMMFQTMTEDQGLQARWTTTARVEKGELRARAPRVVLLPDCLALNAEEIEELQVFVEGGGTLIADVCPALYSDRVRPLEEGALNGLFGIRRKGVAAELVSGTLTMAKDCGPVKAGTAVMGTLGDLAVQADTATAYASVGDAPAVLVNRHGKGQAVLLNAYIGRYAALLDKGEAGPMRDLFREILKQGGVERAYVAREKGRDAAGCELIPFRLGPHELLGVAIEHLRDARFPVEIDIRLPRERHVYDMRRGAYLGRTDVIRTRCHFMDRKVFALLDGETGALRLRAQPDTVHAGGDASLSVELAGGAGPRLFRLDVTDPEGNERLEFRRKLWSDDGRLRMAVPFAWNDMPGKWRLRVTDVLTGVSGETEIALGASERGQ